VKPHGRTKYGGPHAALRAADVNKSIGYADSKQIGNRKRRHSLGHPPTAPLRDLNGLDPDMQAGL